MLKYCIIKEYTCFCSIYRPTFITRWLCFTIRGPGICIGIFMHYNKGIEFWNAWMYRLRKLMKKTQCSDITGIQNASNISFLVFLNTEHRKNSFILFYEVRWMQISMFKNFAYFHHLYGYCFLFFFESFSFLLFILQYIYFLDLKFALFLFVPSLNFFPWQ